MPLEQLHTVFHAIILQRLAYALPAWGSFLSVDLKHKIDGFLKGSYRYGFIKEMFHIQTIIDCMIYSTRLKPQTIVSRPITYYLLNDHSMMQSESEDISFNYLTAYTNFTSNLSL